MAKGKSGGSSNNGMKVSFSNHQKGRTSIGNTPGSIKFSTMNRKNVQVTKHIAVKEDLKRKVDR
jgi:hypothetical protein